MSEFVKPKTVFVSDSEYIQNLVNANLRKDLHDNEEICPHCHGTGLVISDNPYGLSDDPDKTIGAFPYEHQAISFCPYCFNGIVHRCEHCGQIISKGYLKHDCQKQREIDAAELEKKRSEQLYRAQFAPPEVLDQSYFFYSDDYGNDDGYFSDWDEFFDYWHENGETIGDERPEFVWATYPVEMHIDARDIVSNATEELYEDAYDDVDNKKIKELQEFLDKWCKDCGVTTTYYESPKYKVRIPWENYDSEDKDTYAWF